MQACEIQACTKDSSLITHKRTKGFKLLFFLSFQVHGKISICVVQMKDILLIRYIQIAFGMSELI